MYFIFIFFRLLFFGAFFRYFVDTLNINDNKKNSTNYTSTDTYRIIPCSVSYRIN